MVDFDAKYGQASTDVFRTPTKSRGAGKMEMVAPLTPENSKGLDKQESRDSGETRQSSSQGNARRADRSTDRRKPFQPKLGTVKETVIESVSMVEVDQGDDSETFIRGPKRSLSSYPSVAAALNERETHSDDSQVLQQSPFPSRSAVVGPSPSESVTVSKPQFKMASVAKLEDRNDRSARTSRRADSAEEDGNGEGVHWETRDRERGWGSVESGGWSVAGTPSRRVEESNGGAHEIELLRQRLVSVERDLTEERILRRKAEENASSTIQGYERKLRDAVDSCEDRCKEVARKTRNEVNEEARENVKILERKYNSEIDDLKSSLQGEKRKTEELKGELEVLRRKMAQVIDEARSETSADLEKMKIQLSDAETALINERKELKKLREEYASMASKLAASLQISSVAQAEMEALRVSSASATAEAQTCHAALLQATQRMQQLDSEVVALKAENYLIKQEGDANISELRKLRLVASTNGDRAQLIESEVKRKNTQLQVRPILFYSLVIFRRTRFIDLHQGWLNLSQ